ncbi:MAG: ferredoxin [Candidatus Nealsonbacteria bacterium]|nr:ferredoxin [Candidatus Nealsonbacteria bacterium]
MNENVKDKNRPSGPIKIGEVIVEVDRDLCIGAGTCVALAPRVFALDQDGKSVILDTADSELEQTLLEAARSCPVAAIILKKKSGEKIFPQ